MQQQPEKLRWREWSKKGISASQFGMALGFCGRISDYVTYVREIAGTPQAFQGNEATDHGCRTESKARACYELVTGNKVLNGGFFTVPDRVLACSPDGIVFVSNSGKENTSIRDSAGPSIESIERKPFRLLEIKCPFRSLYDGSKKGYQPHGIPLHYMCQMQGQMAISGAEECDFFVFLDTPEECQVVCWRVRWSSAFWEWCEPNLRVVSNWIENGLPEGVDRNYRFTRFDFNSLDVTSLVAPFSITKQRHILDLKRFGYFYKHFGNQKLSAPPSTAVASLFGAHCKHLQKEKSTSSSASNQLSIYSAGAESQASQQHSSPSGCYTSSSLKSPSSTSYPPAPTIRKNSSFSQPIPWPINSQLLWPAARIMFSGAHAMIKEGADVTVMDVEGAGSSTFRLIYLDWEASSATFMSEGTMSKTAVGFHEQSFWQRLRLARDESLFQTTSPIADNSCGFEEASGMISPSISFGSYISALSMSKELEERLSQTQPPPTFNAVATISCGTESSTTAKVRIAETPNALCNGLSVRRVPLRTMLSFSKSEVEATKEESLKCSTVAGIEDVTPSPKVLALSVPPLPLSLNSPSHFNALFGTELDVGFEWFKQFRHGARGSYAFFLVSSLADKPTTAVEVMVGGSNNRKDEPFSGETFKIFCFPSPLLARLFDQGLSSSGQVFYDTASLTAKSIGSSIASPLLASGSRECAIDLDSASEDDDVALVAPTSPDAIHPELAILRQISTEKSPSSVPSRESSSLVHRSQSMDEKKLNKFSILPKRLSQRQLSNPESAIVSDATPPCSAPKRSTNTILISVGLVPPRDEALGPKCAWVKTIWTAFTKRVGQLQHQSE